MYKLVFLLIFSVISVVTGAGKITLDIYFKPIKSTNKYEIKCDVKPTGVQHVAEGENIQFYVQTRTPFKDLRCDANGVESYNPSDTNKERCDGQSGDNIEVWRMVVSNSVYQSYMNGTWKCTALIKKPNEMNINTAMHPDGYVQSTCSLEFKVTVPRVTLNIQQLTRWEWLNQNQKQGKKQYDYYFIEGETKLDCVLNNPTEYNETYKLIFKMDNSELKNISVTVTRHMNQTLSHIFNLNKENKVILCLAVHKAGSSNGTNLENHIRLHKIPRLVITFNGQNLTEKQYFQDNYTRTYDYDSYDYIDGDKVDVECSLSEANGIEQQYELLFLEGDTRAGDKQSNKHIRNSFTLREGRRPNIICMASGSGDSTFPSLFSIVNLHYRTPDAPPVQASRQGRLLARTPVLSVSATRGPGKLFCKENKLFCNYNFTDDKYVILKCTLDNNAEYERAYVVFYAYNERINKNELIKETGKDLNRKKSTQYKFKLEKKNTVSRLGCAAYSQESNQYVLRHDILIYINYEPTHPTLSIEAVPNKLQRLSDKKYTYNYIEYGENITLICSLSEPEYMNDYCINIVKRMYNKTHDIYPPEGLDKALSVHRTFTLEEGLKALLCQAFACNTGKSLKKIDLLTINLHYTGTPAVETTVRLNVVGLPANSSCRNVANSNIEKICTHTFENPGLLELKCVFTGTYVKNCVYEVIFGERKNVTVEASKPINGEVTTRINLLGQNTTITCVARRMAAQLPTNNIVTIHFIYSPPPTSPPTTTTEELTTTAVATSIEEASTKTSLPRSTEPSGGSLNDGGDPLSQTWVQGVLGGGVLLLTLSIIGCGVAMCRQKKSKPAESTYANLAKDQSTYQTMPVPTPRAVQKPSKPKVTVENNYSDPKDAQDMSEAMYAAPNRFNHESETYAEPCVEKSKLDYAEPYAKSKPSPRSDTYVEPYATVGPKSDTYAEPCKSNYAEPYSNTKGNYAQLDLPKENRELYAKPIPKAQRMPKVKDDSNYSNVFGDDYANTKK